jgi:hypothetical protein
MYSQRENGMSTLTVDLVERTLKSNRIKVLFSSEASLNAEDEAIADDPGKQDERADRIGNNGIVEESLKLPACSDKNQAQRLADQYLAEHDSNLVYTWKTNIKGLALQPGDLVDVVHDIYPATGKLFRIETIDHDELDGMTITASEYIPSAYI